MSDSPPDVVYVVRAGERNEALRYSLRSIHRNLPHARVWIAGHCPRWVTGVRCLPVPQQRSKWENSTANLRAAAQHPQVADRIVYSNDDFYVVVPVDHVEMLHRGPAREVMARFRGRGIGNSQWMRGMAATLRFLARLGIPDPPSYELHVPMPMEKRLLRTVLDLPARHGVRVPALHKRTLYGAYWHVGGRQAPDVKLSGRRPHWPPHWQFVSTSRGMMDTAGHPVGERLRDLFPSPCPYERRPGQRPRPRRF